MRKRKIMGILQYGTRGYNNATQKFQEGGFVAVSKGYDWRDDPYEIMLLQQKAAYDNASIRSSKKGGSSSSTGGKNIDTFERIEGGLTVTNEAYNALTQKTQEAYYAKVSEGGVEWATSAEGQIAYQRIVNESNRLEELAVKEEKNFTEALGKIDSDEDRHTLAVSSDNNLMVWDTTGKGKKVSMGTYLGNVDKFKVMNIDEFANWKKDSDTALQSGLTDEFLKKNAVGHNTLRKIYIDGKDDQIQYAFRDGKIMKKSATGEGEGTFISDIEQFKNGLNNLMLGQDFYTASSVNNAAKVDYSTEVVESVYSDIMGGTADGSKLAASLTAELLADNKHKQKIFSIEGLAAKEAYLEEQKKILLVSKVIDKNKKSASGGGAGAGGEGPSVHKTDASPLYADMEAMYDASEVSQYTIGVGAEPLGNRKVMDVNMPMIKDGLNPSDLGLVMDPAASVDAKQANKLNSNKALHVYSDTTTLYLPSGDNLEKILGSGAAVRQFMAEDSVIAPDETMPIVFMPMDKDGNLKNKDVLELAGIKVSARQAFIASSRGKLKDSNGRNIVITTKAEDLLPGNLQRKAAEDSREYLMWIQKGIDYKKHQQALQASPGNKALIANFEMARDAQAVIQKTTAAFSNKFRGKPVQMQPMLGTWVVFDNDRFDVKEGIEKRLGGGFGSKMVVKATESEKEFLQDVNGVDNSNWLSDNVYKMMVFSKVKSLKRAAAESGEKLEGVARYAEITDKMLNFTDMQSAITHSGKQDNISLFLMQ